MHALAGVICIARVLARVLLPKNCATKTSDPDRPRREGPSARDGHEGPRLRPILLVHFIAV